MSYREISPYNVLKPKISLSSYSGLTENPSIIRRSYQKSYQRRSLLHNKVGDIMRCALSCPKERQSQLAYSMNPSRKRGSFYSSFDHQTYNFSQGYDSLEKMLASSQVQEKVIPKRTIIYSKFKKLPSIRRRSPLTINQLLR